MWLNFLPIISFVILFVGSGIYFSIQGNPQGFYVVSPLSAIIPAVAMGFLFHKGNTNQKTNDFLEGIGNKDILMMCVIFLLAGIFTEITNKIGSVTNVVNMALAIIPTNFLLTALFLVAALVSTSIGTSMGTIATIAPIAAKLSTILGTDFPLAMATVVGGAMFGDNLSIVSDTTIASVMSQGADMGQKFKLNAKIALMAGAATVLILIGHSKNYEINTIQNFELILITPYFLLILLSLCGVNILTSLFSSIIFASAIGCFLVDGFNGVILAKCFDNGIKSMSEIIFLSMMIGGLSGLAGKHFIEKLANKISNFATKRQIGTKGVQILIAKIVTFFDLMVANNTIAIIISGKLVKDLATKHKISPNYSALWMDIFACVTQGIIPYGAQILLTSAIAQVSPLEIYDKVYYCYILGGISILFIIFSPTKNQTQG